MPAPVSGPSAETLAAAIVRLAGFRGQAVMVKLGGSAMEDPAAAKACFQSVAALHLVGVCAALVHGGGKPIDRAMEAAGLVPKKVAGRRYTDKATLDIVVRVLKDEINRDLVAQLKALGANARSESELLEGKQLRLRGADGSAIDLGRVGEVKKVDRICLISQVEEGLLPVIPSLARDANDTEGGWLNVNADTAAAAVAGALQADKAVFLTDTPGVLRDRNDPESLLPRLTEAECRGLIEAGVIDGGMIPKVEACFDALEAGAKAAYILDGRAPFSLLDLFIRDTFSGTEITR